MGAVMPQLQAGLLIVGQLMTPQHLLHKLLYLCCSLHAFAAPLHTWFVGHSSGYDMAHGEDRS